MMSPASEVQKQGRKRIAIVGAGQAGLQLGMSEVNPGIRARG